MVWTGVNGHNLDTERNDHLCCNHKQKNWLPKRSICVFSNNSNTCFTEITFVINMEDNDDWLASNKTLKKWTRIGDGELLSYAGIDFHKPKDEKQSVQEIKRRKKLNNRKLDNNRKLAAQKRNIEYPDQLKQVENNKNWKEFTNLKPGIYMTYKSRQYSQKDEHKLMKAIIAQKKSYNNEQERKRQKTIQEMNPKNLLEGV
jgi:hypothetical protein